MHSKQNDTVLQLKQHQQQAVKAERRLGNTSTRDQQQRAHTAQHQPIGPSLGRIPPGQSGGPPPAWPVSVPGDGGADSASWLMGAPVK